MICGSWVCVATWWESQSWGSVPDWFAAVGTVGALFLGLAILLMDRRRARRVDADAFSTWYVQRVASHDEWGMEYGLIVNAHNAGSKPVPVAVVESPRHEPGYTYEFLNGNESIEPIDPNVSVRRVIDYKDEPPRWEHLIVRFSDSSGHVRQRQLITNRYISQRRYLRMMKDSFVKRQVRKWKAPRE